MSDEITKRRGMADSWKPTAPDGGSVNVAENAHQHGANAPEHGAAGGSSTNPPARPAKGRTRDLPAKGTSNITESHPSLGGPR